MSGIGINVKIPKYLWQCLVVMAEEDYRTREDFLIWLLHRESENRELIYRREKCKQNN